MQENIKDKIKTKLTFSAKKITPNLFQADITLDSSTVKSVYNQTLKMFQRQTVLPGFKKKCTPIEYLEKNFKGSIESNIKNYLFKHYVIDYLVENIHKEKITIANYPRLKGIKTMPKQDMIFSFEISVAPPIELKEWKFFIFRAPKRKKYKDLDKQVSLFIKRESNIFKKNKLSIIEENDWVLFTTNLVNENNQVILESQKSYFWIKINNKYITKSFHSSLINKKINDSIITDHFPMKNDFSSEQEQNHFSYKITIKKITKGKSFSLDSFKDTFKLKSKTEVHNKLIEVFSYRNDISQRKAIIEEVFHLLLSKHRFEVPKHFVIRRQEEILSYLKKHPDYTVYRQNKDFYPQLAMLAEKQLKEEILIDQIAYRENLEINHNDIQNYLYLFNNNRLKEFVYFKPILQKIDESETPLQTGLLKQYVFREKTLNHIIHELTK
jgi:FKBP-type peptidyl-prolyl cis-trans isomerase (trigger factor)